MKANGAALISAERVRQVEEEGYSTLRDSGHTAGELESAVRAVAQARKDNDGDPA